MRLGLFLITIGICNNYCYTEIKLLLNKRIYTKVAKDSESLRDFFTIDTVFVPKHLIFMFYPLWEDTVPAHKNVDSGSNQWGNSFESPKLVTKV